MTASKLALSIPEDIVRRAKREVSSARAKSLSAYVSEALAEKLQRDELKDVLDAMDKEHGKPDRKAKRWAKRVLSR